MMDFNKKEDVIQKIKMNGTLQEMVLMYQQLALQYANMVSPQEGEKVANVILQQTTGQQAPQQMMGANTDAVNPEEHNEHPVVERARTEARTSTQAD
jgi:hypothetical protein